MTSPTRWPAPFPAIEAHSPECSPVRRVRRFRSRAGCAPSQLAVVARDDCFRELNATRYSRRPRPAGHFASAEILADLASQSRRHPRSSRTSAGRALDQHLLVRIAQLAGLHLQRFERRMSPLMALSASPACSGERRSPRCPASPPVDLQRLHDPLHRGYRGGLVSEALQDRRRARGRAHRLVCNLADERMRIDLGRHGLVECRARSARFAGSVLTLRQAMRHVVQPLRRCRPVCASRIRVRGRSWRRRDGRRSGCPGGVADRAGASIGVVGV